MRVIEKKQKDDFWSAGHMFFNLSRIYIAYSAYKNSLNYTLIGTLVNMHVDFSILVQMQTHVHF